MKTATREERLIAAVKHLADSALKRDVTTLKKRLARMESLKDNWRETALRREAEIKQLKEDLRVYKRISLERQSVDLHDRHATTTVHK